MEIEENKAITLADGCDYLVLRKILYQNEYPYLFCMNISKGGKLALLRFLGENVSFVDDPEELFMVLDSLNDDPRFLADKEMLSAFIEDLKNSGKK